MLRCDADWRDAFVLETNDLPLLRDADTIHVFLLRGLHLAHNLIAVATELVFAQTSPQATSIARASFDLRAFRRVGLLRPLIVLEGGRFFLAQNSISRQASTLAP
jgi:hypothetical protein